MPELASFSESSRQSALQHFQLLRAHLEDGQPLAAIAREANIPYRTLQYWLERYRTSGLAALARKPRIDRGRRRKLSAALQEAIEGLALKKPPLSIRVVCNQAKLLADRLGEEAPTYDLVYDVVNRSRDAGSSGGKSLRQLFRSDLPARGGPFKRDLAGRSYAARYRVASV
jgi:putative transposase